MRYLIFFIFDFASAKKAVINTWAFPEANEAAWNVLSLNGNVLDAVTTGTAKCEELQCDGTVGWGNKPDESGEVTLDAMIMDGRTGNVGGVGGLRRVKNAAGVARHVLDHTLHSLLVGSSATDFALQMGFKEEPLEDEETNQQTTDWIDNKCQPNFWINVTPNSSLSCGPYTVGDSNDFKEEPIIDKTNHDTIGMVVVNDQEHVSAGTTTNGLRHKIPGRVGDSPIPGAGSYANEHGGAAATGNGDIMMRFLPTYQTVENMRLGMNPEQAAQDAINRIVSKYPDFGGAIVAMNARGDHGVACHNMRLQPFPYVVQSDETKGLISLSKMCSQVGDQLIDQNTGGSSSSIIASFWLLTFLVL